MYPASAAMSLNPASYMYLPRKYNNAYISGRIHQLYAIEKKNIASYRPAFLNLR
jgi:hypothetical protein